MSSGTSSRSAVLGMDNHNDEFGEETFGTNRSRREIIDVDEATDDSCGPTTTGSSSQRQHSHVITGTHLPKFTIPNGQPIDPKNTLRSYDHVTARVIRSRRTPSQELTSTLPPLRSSVVSGNKSNDTAITGTTQAVSEENIIHAVAVRSLAVASAERIDGSFLSWNTKRLCALLSFSFACLVAVAAGVGAGVYCGLGNCTSKPEPLQSKKEETVANYINNVTLSGRKLNVNGSTAEEKALTWLIYHDPWLLRFESNWLPLISTSTSSPQHIKVCQRFALSTLWFQQPLSPNGDGKETWHKRDKWLSHENECEWFGVSCKNENIPDAITGIDFYIEASDDLDKGNKFIGTLPADLGLLSSIQLFDFSYNDLFGTLPEAIGNWTDLTYFNISSNKMEGTLPESVGRWTNLKYFNVYSGTPENNNITGSLPESITGWGDIEYFDIRHNTFTGSLPESIGSWTSLVSFFIANNALEGTVPTSIGSWSSIQVAYFNNNTFTGTIPDQICRDGLSLAADCPAKNSCTDFDSCV